MVSCHPCPTWRTVACRLAASARWQPFNNPRTAGRGGGILIFDRGGGLGGRLRSYAPHSTTTEPFLFRLGEEASQNGHSAGSRAGATGFDAASGNAMFNGSKAVPVPASALPQSETLQDVQRVASTTIPSTHGTLRVVAFRSSIGDILAVVSGIGDGSRVPVRVHDACLTGEVFGSLKCDCGLQLQMTLEDQTEKQFGVILYMPQEGRGIGLANKIAAYYLQEVHGLDTVDANLALGLPAEMRDYTAVSHVLQDLQVRSVMLMTNNPFKVQRLRAAGVRVEGTLPVVATATSSATGQYLETKRQRMGHTLPQWRPPADGGSSQPLVGADVNSEAFDGASTPAAKLLSSVQQATRAHVGCRPYTLLSFATSMDGFIGGLRTLPDGTQEHKPVSLSGAAAILLTHHLRASMDAILVGIGTVLSDNPRLDARAGGAGPSPRPIVLDSQLRLPVTSRLLTYKPAGGRPPVLVLCTQQAAASRRIALEAAGAKVVTCRTDRAGKVCLDDAWGRLANFGVQSIMVEGGSQIIAGLLGDCRGLVDQVVVTQASVMLGSGVRWPVAGGARLVKTSTFSLGDDAIFAGCLGTG